jgi:hypothetical protein
MQRPGGQTLVQKLAKSHTTRPRKKNLLNRFSSAAADERRGAADEETRAEVELTRRANPSSEVSKVPLVTKPRKKSILKRFSRSAAVALAPRVAEADAETRVVTDEETRAVVDETRAVVGETRAVVGETRAVVDETRAVVGETRAVVDETRAVVDETRAVTDEVTWRANPNSEVSKVPLVQQGQDRRTYRIAFQGQQP